jgi:hypothetical protein
MKLIDRAAASIRPSSRCGRRARAAYWLAGPFLDLSAVSRSPFIVSRKQRKPLDQEQNGRLLSISSEEEEMVFAI